MHGHHDSDHYDVQFTTRQLVLMFGLLISIVVGVFVGGIVIGRGMAPGAADAVMARRTNPVPVPTPARTPAGAVAEAPAEDALRLPIRSEPQPAARTPERAPVRQAASPAAPTSQAPRPAASNSPVAPAAEATRPPARTASTSPEQLSGRTLAARSPRAAAASPSPRTAAATPAPPRTADRPTATRQWEVHHSGCGLPRPVGRRADVATARGAGNRGVPRRHSGRDLPGPGRAVREPRGGPGAGGSAGEREVRDSGHEPLSGLRRSSLRFGRNTPGQFSRWGLLPHAPCQPGPHREDWPHRENWASPASALTRVPPPAARIPGFPPAGTIPGRNPMSQELLDRYEALRGRTAVARGFL